VVGTTAGILMDGALLIETTNGRRVAVRPQKLGVLERVDLKERAQGTAPERKEPPSPGPA